MNAGYSTQFNTKATMIQMMGVGMIFARPTIKLMPKPVGADVQQRPTRKAKSDGMPLKSTKPKAEHGTFCTTCAMKVTV